MTIKNTVLSLLACAAAATVLPSCYEDKGNYEYSEIEKIEIYFGTDEEGGKITEFYTAAMRNSEYIEFDPTVVSSIAGEIAEGDPRYEFGCKISYNPNDARWSDIDTLKTKSVKYLATMPAGTYTLWYTVTNKETGVVTSAQGKAKVIISTYEGWMVASNNGTDNRTRLDMIFTDSKGEEQVATDLLGTESPEIYNATAIVMNPTKKGQVGDQIFLLSESGGYQLNVTYLTTRLSDNIKVFDFMYRDEPGEVVAWNGIYNGYGGGNQSQVCVTSTGNAYAQHVFGAGSGFEYPINADEVGAEPSYKVAPFIGHACERPGASNCALFYDIDNKRFMGYDYSLEGAEGRLLFPIRVQGTQYFPFETGMDIIDMESTKFASGMVYTVLQDGNAKRHVYAIDMSGNNSSNCFRQEAAYDNISATDFHKATDYAFHSQFPLMFYCKGNKVYCYNIATGRLCDTITLSNRETVTKIKFNLFQSQYAWFDNPSQDFLQQQFELIVASTTGRDNGGIVRFYTIDTDGKMEQKKEFKGFGQNVVDVTYRERIPKNMDF